MVPFPHQYELAEEVMVVLRRYGVAYLASEERTGKTLAAILAAESSLAEQILVVTKKKALDGWNETLAKFPHKKMYFVTNYHQVHKTSFKPGLVIIDEAHNYISGYPKPSAMLKTLRAICAGLPILFLSATPRPQGTQQLFHQLSLSDWSPWAQYKNFYRWFDVYGIPYSIQIEGIATKQYNKTKDIAWEHVKHLFITKTRAALDFEFEPEDKLHYVELSSYTKNLYNKLLKDRLVRNIVGDEPLVCDTQAKYRVALHQIEGGTIKLESGYKQLPNTEKIDYILATWGDSPDLVIMHNYKEEAKKLAEYFSQARILQATSFAEGVDLSMYKHLVIYSQDFSTARHTQRRARQANKQRKEPIIVHFLLVKKAVSERVYKTVSINKKNFVDTVFEEL